MKTYRIVLFFIIIFGISYVIYNVNKANEDFAKPSETLTKVLQEPSRADSLTNVKK